MPIRINLLAEQIEAEEARRRDPVKRAIWVGSGVVAITVLLVVWYQFQLVSTRSALQADQSKLKSIEPDAKAVRENWASIAEIETRVESLNRYASNRFLWSQLLDALQRTPVDGVRVVAIDSTHSFSSAAESRFRTNITFPRTTKSKWKFWDSSPQADIRALLDNQLAVITNRAEFITNKIPPVTSVNITTNATRVVAAVEIVQPATASERIVLTIDARDYSDEPGTKVDEFSRSIGNLAYFKQQLQTPEGRGIRLKERAIRPEFDPLDPTAPDKPYIPFTIECQFEERVFAK